MHRMNVFVVVVQQVFQAVGHIAQVAHIVVVAEDAGTIVVVLHQDAQLAGNVQTAVLMVEVMAEVVLMNVLVMLVAILYLVEDIVQPVLEIMYIVQIVEYVLIMDMIIVM